MLCPCYSSATTYPLFHIHIFSLTCMTAQSSSFLIHNTANINPMISAICWKKINLPGVMWGNSISQLLTVIHPATRTRQSIYRTNPNCSMIRVYLVLAPGVKGEYYIWLPLTDNERYLFAQRYCRFNLTIEIPLQECYRLYS